MNIYFDSIFICVYFSIWSLSLGSGIFELGGHHVDPCVSFWVLAYNCLKDKVMLIKVVVNKFVHVGPDTEVSNSEVISEEIFTS